MHIVHVVESLEIGGLEHMVVALGAQQVARGHQVEIICLWSEGPLMARALDAGIKVACCHKKSGFDIPAFLKLRQLIRQANADVLHTHNAMSHYYSVAAALGLKTPSVISTRHGYGKRNLNGRGERFYKQAMRRTDFGVSVSKSLEDYFVSGGLIPPQKARAIANGIDLSRFYPRTDENATRLRKQLGLPESAVTFGTVGRLNAVKRQVDLLNALRLRLDAGDNCCLVIAGDGPMRTSLEEEIARLKLEPYVRLLGARNDVPDLLAAMDVFVLCSRSEGYSLALVEASASALPIIATDVGGNSEIVCQDKTGLIVPALNVPTLAEAMGQLCNAPNSRIEFGAAARRWALQYGSLEAMTDAYENLYRPQ